MFVAEQAPVEAIVQDLPPELRAIIRRRRNHPEETEEAANRAVYTSLCGKADEIPDLVARAELALAEHGYTIRDAANEWLARNWGPSN